MIDNFSILLSHALLALAFWLLLKRPELDAEESPVPDAEPIGFAPKKPAVSRNGKRPPDA